VGPARGPPRCDRHATVLWPRLVGHHDVIGTPPFCGPGSPATTMWSARRRFCGPGSGATTMKSARHRPVGAGLLANRLCQPPPMVTDPSRSPASRLLQTILSGREW
jgi:hypothetical protein